MRIYPQLKGTRMCRPVPSPRFDRVSSSTIARCSPFIFLAILVSNFAGCGGGGWRWPAWPSGPVAPPPPCCGCAAPLLPWFSVLLFPSTAVSSLTNKGDVMEIQSSGSRPSAKGPEDWFTGTGRIDPLFDRAEPASAAPSLPSSPAHAQPGTPTRSGRRSLSQPVLVGCRRREKPCRKSGRVMWSGLLPVKGTGTAADRRTQLQKAE